MKVFEIYLKVYLLRDITLDQCQRQIFKLVDVVLGKDNEKLKLHLENQFKNYCFNSFYPLEKDGIYKEGNIYTIIIRTTDENLEEYFRKNLSFAYTRYIKALQLKCNVIPYKKINRIYSITPVVIKNDEGYWRNLMKIEDYERRIRENLIKKYNSIIGGRINEDFQLWTNISFKNNLPIASEYKGRKILGDKLTIDIADNKLAQELAHMALGTGIGEMNARGFGFVGSK